MSQINSVLPALDSLKSHIASPLVSLGFLAGLGSVIGSSCCAIPVFLASAGVGSGVFSGLIFLAAWRVPLLIFSVGAVAAGWLLYFRKRDCAEGCEPPRRSRLAASTLLLSSFLIVAAMSWNAAIEPQLIFLERHGPT